MTELPKCPIHKIHILGKRCDMCTNLEELRIEELDEKLAKAFKNDKSHTKRLSE